MIDAVTAPSTDTEASPTPTRRRLPIGRLDGVLVATVVAGAALRLWGLGAQSLWYDEWLTANAASGSLGNLRAYITGQAGIPPAYFTLMWVWARVVGDGDAALRLVSALAGIATIPVTYAAVREMGRPRTVARAASLVVAVSPNLVWYSQEARPYSLLALLGAVSLLFLARLWRRGGRGNLVTWALVCAVAVTVHYFAAFLVAAELVAVLLVCRPRRRDLLAAGAAAGVVLALLAPFAVAQFGHKDKHSWITDYGLRLRLTDAGQSLLVGPTPTDNRAWMLGAAVVALAVALVVARGDRRERRIAAALGVLGVAPVVLALGAAAVGVDFVLARYIIVVQVLGVVLVALGLFAARVPRAVGYAGLSVLCALLLFTTVTDARDPQLQRTDWRAVADAHDASPASGGPRLLVMNLHGYLGQPLLRYLDGARVLGPDESVSVDQIDVIVAQPSSRPCNGFVGLECMMIFLGAPLPEPLADDFALDERVEVDRFAIDRYRGDRPVPVKADDVVPEIDWGRHLVLVTGEG